MIPRYFPEDGEPSEKPIYELLEQIEMEGEWYAFHSQNVAKHHQKKQWCELDFVIVGPRGILVLEVKGGKIRREQGIWIGTNKAGKEHRKKESPFDQAKDGRYALEKALEEYLGGKYPSYLLYGWGVVFPDIPFDAESVEMAKELLADERHSCDAEGFQAFIEGLYHFWDRQVHYSPQQIERTEILEMVKVLRPNFDLVPKLNNMAVKAGREFVRMTDEQYMIMDAVEDSERIICRGGAGTGKSFIALECARRESAAGRSVLMVAESDVFTSYLAIQTQGSDVVVKSLAELKSASASGDFDVLIVDEGQDLMSCEVIDLLDAFLKGGIEKGRWRWFMDSNNQVGIAGAYESDAEKLLQDYCETPLRLKKNVRNIKPIATQTQLVTGADIGVAESFGTGNPPDFVHVGSEEEEVKQLGRLLSELLNREGVEPGQVAIVSFRDFDSSACSRLPNQLSSGIHVLSSETAGNHDQGGIVFSTVADFKGLERRFVLVTDLWACSDLSCEIPRLYVAMTRAQFGLTVFLPTRLADDLERFKEQHAVELLNMNQ